MKNKRKTIPARSILKAAGSMRSTSTPTSAPHKSSCLWFLSREVAAYCANLVGSNGYDKNLGSNGSSGRVFWYFTRQRIVSCLYLN